MELYFILKDNDKYHTLKTTFDKDILHIEMEDEIEILDNLSTINNYNLVSLEDLGTNNYNLLNITGATTLRNLRKKIFNKTYIPKTIRKKIEIIIDCFLQLCQNETIKLDDNIIENFDDITKTDSEKSEIIDDMIETKDVTSEDEKDTEIKDDIEPSKPKNGSRVMILLAIGFLAGFYTKKFLIK